MKISERAVKRSILTSIKGAAGEGADLAGVEVDASPVEIVTAVNKFVSKRLRKTARRVDNWTDRPLPLGSLVGRTVGAPIRMGVG